MNEKLKDEALQYDLDALKEGVEKCKKNITIFEDVIAKEYNKIKEYRAMIAFLEERQNSNVSA